MIKTKYYNNQCGTLTEAGAVQSDSKVRKVMQSFNMYEIVKT